MGCQMNAADSRRLAQQLEHVGFSPTPQPEEADLVVLNTCVVKQQAEDRIYGRLGSLKTVKERRPGLTIALMGCMVGVKEAPRLKKAFPFVDVFMPPSDTQPLLDHLQTSELLADVMDAAARERALRDALQDGDLLLPLEERGRSVTAFVPVVLGCSHACSFCIIPYRRGKERSRPVADILAETRNLAAQGVREIMLLGQIVDRYGADLGDVDLADLLRQIHEIDGLARIRFLTSHPNWVSENLPLPNATVKTECERYIVLPGQATSYMIGQLKIVDLRERASAALGDRFDLAEFHDVGLRNGAEPLENLEEFVDEWIAAQKS
jgi:tRNA-2-methylthio-N6-dimethylallyladenosine synthase